MAREITRFGIGGRAAALEQHETAAQAQHHADQNDIDARVAVRPVPGANDKEPRCRQNNPKEGMHRG